MAYQIENGLWSSVFAVPADIVDKHIKLCGPLSLKVLLVMLRHGGVMQPEELAGLLNQPCADVQDAMNYWVAQGIIQQSDAPARGMAAPAAAPQPAEEEAGAEPEAQGPETGERRVARITRSRQRMSTQEINEMALQDETITYLLQETQACLGRPLTPVATDVVVALYSYYGMQPDLVLMLLQYCASIGKDNMRYVEKVAASWLEKGIDTHEKAEKEILRRTREKQSEGKIKTLFGIYDRNLVASEKKYINTWLEDYKMDSALIQLAFERTVELKGKLSFAYINGILTNWHNKGIRNPAQAVQDMQQGRQQQAKEAGAAGSSYDMDELEDMIAYSDII